MKLLYASLLALLSPNLLFSQAPFYQLLPQSDNDNGREIVALPSRNMLLLASHSGDIAVLKSDPNGNILSSYKIGETNKKEGLISAQSLADGNILLNVVYSPTNISYQPELIKIDTNANVLWVKKYPLSGITFFNLVLTQFDSSLYALSRQYSQTYLYQISQDGTLLSTLTLDSLNVYDMGRTPDSGFVLVGKRYDREFESFVIKLDANRNKVWEKTITGNFSSGSLLKVAVMQSGEMVVAGDLDLIAPDALPDIVMLRLDETGEEIWREKHKANHNPLTYLGFSGNDSLFELVSYLITQNIFNPMNGIFYIDGGAYTYRTSDGSPVCQYLQADVSLQALYKAADKGLYLLGEYHTDVQNGKKILLFIKTDSSCKSITHMEVPLSQQPKLKVLPNPATDYVQMELEGDEIIGFALLDFTGKKLLSLSFAGIPNPKIPLPKLTAGLYLYQVETKKGGLLEGKILIEK